MPPVFVSARDTPASTARRPRAGQPSSIYAVASVRDDVVVRGGFVHARDINVAPLSPPRCVYRRQGVRARGRSPTWTRGERGRRKRRPRRRGRTVPPLVLSAGEFSGSLHVPSRVRVVYLVPEGPERQRIRSGSSDVCYTCIPCAQVFACLGA